MGFLESLFSGTTGILAVIALLVILPTSIIGAIRKDIRHKREIELQKLKFQKEMLELDIEKQRNEIKLLEEENKKLDNIIKYS